jgi:hypothetical protein
MSDGYELLRQVERLVAKSRAARPNLVAKPTDKRKRTPPAHPMPTIRRTVQFLPASLSIDGQGRFVEHYL